MPFVAGIAEKGLADGRTVWGRPGRRKTAVENRFGLTALWGPAHL